jgi:hypothetical protein
MQRADRALYGAKATGRDGIVVAPVFAPLVAQPAPTLRS